jgi:hypothetical protein
MGPLTLIRFVCQPRNLHIEDICGQDLMSRDGGEDISRTPPVLDTVMNGYHGSGDFFAS